MNIAVGFVERIIFQKNYGKILNLLHLYRCSPVKWWFSCNKRYGFWFVEFKGFVKKNTNVNFLLHFRLYLEISALWSISSNEIEVDKIVDFSLLLQKVNNKKGTKLKKYIPM